MAFLFARRPGAKELSRKESKSMPGRIDPLTTGRFRVQFGGTDIAVSHLSGLAAWIDILDYQTGASATLEDFREPGQRRLANLVLKRPLTGDLTFWTLFNNTQQGTLARSDGSIQLLDAQLSPIVTWSFKNGWPCRWTGPELSAASNELATESLEICYESLEMTASAGA